MKERPILFSGEMVRALLDGRKTQTRRTMKPQPEPCVDERAGHRWPSKSHQSMLHVEREMQNGDGGWEGLPGDACPHGKPGDRLWVKERIQRGYCGNMSMSRYMADDFPTVADAWPWKRDHLPSIHCPRGLSRILLEITNVRVERVQEISSSDAAAEGMETDEFLDHDEWQHSVAPRDADIPCTFRTLRSDFEKLWDSINAKRGYGWDANPFVWVIEFKRIKP